MLMLLHVVLGHFLYHLTFLLSQLHLSSTQVSLPCMLTFFVCQHLFHCPYILPVLFEVGNIIEVENFSTSLLLSKSILFSMCSDGWNLDLNNLIGLKYSAFLPRRYCPHHFLPPPHLYQIPTQKQVLQHQFIKLVLNTSQIVKAVFIKETFPLI